MLTEIKTKNGGRLSLTTDKRIKEDAIRVARTLNPHLGKMYADSRTYGVRYKLANHWPLDEKDMKKFVNQLNELYRRNSIGGYAYVMKTTPWRFDTVCIEVYKKSK